MPFINPEDLKLLENRRLILIVSGGIAAYKAADFARKLTKSGAQVRTILTENAAKFVTPLTFAALTGEIASTEMWNRPQSSIEHIAWADWAEAAIVVPASGNFIAKLAHGIADDLASTFMLAFAGPKMIAPAMNTKMLQNPATQENLKTLKNWGLNIIKPSEGLLACGVLGAGRLPEPITLLWETIRLLTKNELKNHKIVVSAGSTYEAWDAIRILTNRSSGFMGRTLARAAWLKGASVTLVAGPPAKKPLYGIKICPVESTVEMLAMVKESIINSSALIMAAAPADFKPTTTIKEKIKKGQNPEPLTFSQNPDILKTISAEKGTCRLIGFAAESEDLIKRAQQKLKDKKLDFVVANQAGGPNSAFASPQSKAWLVFPNEKSIELPLMPKFELAQIIIENLINLLK